ncbi:hypothetical protein [Halorubrum vacuolatum]|uniref:Uncharacterized protein n=1 Tax=Halorubrum vacuolatum TaxID=63740 RepID=A0A238Y9X6_HALVU|nr:hypothetical protein [Halorubrum vacuolatum]SNR67394.1 hypothetical protein SAMN06264855_13318 [Halorubrum vacuolatum]
MSTGTSAMTDGGDDNGGESIWSDVSSREMAGGAVGLGAALLLFMGVAMVAFFLLALAAVNINLDVLGVGIALILFGYATLKLADRIGTPDFDFDE